MIIICHNITNLQHCFVLEIFGQSISLVTLNCLTKAFDNELSIGVISLDFTKRL